MPRGDAPFAVIAGLVPVVQAQEMEKICHDLAVAFDEVVTIS
jgi:hypothetical protein